LACVWTVSGNARKQFGIRAFPIPPVNHVNGDLKSRAKRVNPLDESHIDHARVINTETSGNDRVLYDFQPRVKIPPERGFEVEGEQQREVPAPGGVQEDIAQLVVPVHLEEPVGDRVALPA
jgi:hypothetical protein